jgi:hypothetical protein
MSGSIGAALRPIRVFARVAFVAAAVLLTGCATQYVDGAVKETPATAYARPAQPHPVQVVFEFQTNGKANARATEHVKPMVMDNVKTTGLFSAVGDTPAPNAGTLSVTINNVALTDDAYRKGFMTGLTFGLAGNVVTDGYVCTVTYLAPGETKPVVKTSKHAIHTAVGSAGAPPGGIKANGIEDAVRTMVRQIMGVTLGDLSHDPAFK